MTTHDYAGYSNWKRWEPADFLVCPPGQARYFDGECKGLSFAAAQVLELGFGNGSFLRYAKDRGAKVSGTELLENAAMSAKAAGISVYRPDLSDAVAEIPGTIDIVAAFDVFEHLALADLTAMFAALERLVKPGGHVIARFPNGQSPLGRHSQYGDHTHRSVLSPSLLMQLLAGRPWRLQRVGNPFQVLAGAGLVKRTGLNVRLAGKRLIERAVNALYGLEITLDPNVVVVLTRL